MPKAQPRETLDELRRRVELPQVMLSTRYLGEVAPTGNNGYWQGVEHDSLIVNAKPHTVHRYHWNSASDSGDVLDYLQRYGGMDLGKSCSWLRDWLGDEKQQVSVQRYTAQMLERVPKTTPKPPNTKVVRRYNEALLNNAEALKWVNDKYGFTSEMIALFEIGYCDEHPVVWKGGELSHEETITFPIYVDDSLVNIRHRLMNPRDGKRRYSPHVVGQNVWPFNLDAMAHENIKRVVIVEGEAKACTAQWHFIQSMRPDTAVIGLTGLNCFVPNPAFSDEPESFVRAFYGRFSHLDEVVLCLDPDADPFETKIKRPDGVVIRRPREWVFKLLEVVPVIRAMTLMMKPDDLLRQDKGHVAFDRALNNARTVRA